MSCTQTAGIFEDSVETCCHTVAFYYDLCGMESTPELERTLTEDAETRAREMIIEGYHQGSLCSIHPHGDMELHGWWRIKEELPSVKAYYDRQV